MYKSYTCTHFAVEDTIRKINSSNEVIKYVTSTERNVVIITVPETKYQIR